MPITSPTTVDACAQGRARLAAYHRLTELATAAQAAAVVAKTQESVASNAVGNALADLAEAAPQDRKRCEAALAAARKGNDGARNAAEEAAAGALAAERRKAEAFEAMRAEVPVMQAVVLQSQADVAAHARALLAEIVAFALPRLREAAAYGQASGAQHVMAALNILCIPDPTRPVNPLADGLRARTAAGAFVSVLDQWRDDAVLVAMADELAQPRQLLTALQREVQAATTPTTGPARWHGRTDQGGASNGSLIDPVTA
ncbi:MAG: hypothetical protein KGI90_07035 [Burkholderiales bacterium]|nr:hypothetical protein [Burkholderiales bacterium]